MISSSKLSRRYGRLEAVKSVDLHVPRASIYGFIGPNGAGKTTTLRMLATLLRPTNGSFTIDDLDPRNDLAKVRARIGWLSDTFGLYEDLTVREYLEYFAAAYLLDHPEEAAEQVVAQVHLEYKLNARIAGLSRGMKQRVGVARALIHQPKVLLLDEPAGGLDPIARIELRDLLKELRTAGTTIIVSSHILSELSDFCDQVGIIERGRLIASGSIEAILARTRTQWRLVLEVIGSAQKAKDILAAHPKIIDVRIETPADAPATKKPEAQPAQPPAVAATSAPPTDVTRIEKLTAGFTGEKHLLPELHAELVKSGIPVVGFYTEAEDLEDLFLRLSTGETG
jgi:ABC-2 type transport system ATP-binding protein